MEVNFISKYFDKVEMPNKKSSDKDNLVNEDIPFEQVLVISDAGEQLGVLNTMDALRIAEDRGYDLVCVAPQAKTPVCKLMDYSKYRYEQNKKAKEAKKNMKRVISLILVAVILFALVPMNASAAEQSGRGRIPQVRTLPSYAAALADAAQADLAVLFYENEDGHTFRAAIEEKPFRTAALLTGPEGGLEVSEVEAAQKAGLQVCR